MSYLLHHTLHTNIPISSFRFISSLSLIENPTLSPIRHDNDPTTSLPFQIFFNQTKTRKPTVKEIQNMHTHVIKTGILHSDIFVANSLTDFYCKSGQMGYALYLFDEISHPNIISWNLMISGYNQSSQYDNSWKFFCKMHSLGIEPNQFTYGGVLSACASYQAIKSGKQVYSLVTKNGFSSDGYVRSGMIDLFAKSFFFDESLRVFQDVQCENVVCWNSIMAGAIRNKEYWVALNLFHQLVSGKLLPNGFTFSSVLTACTALRELEVGRGVHGCFVKSGLQEDVFVGTAIVDFYAKCGDIDEAVKKFSRLKIRNVVSWTAILSGFVQNDDSVSALDLFKKMIASGVEINNYTITSVLTACSKAAMAKEASQIHCWILKTGFSSDSTVIDSLISMYSKLGEIALSEILFKEIAKASGGTWAVMISGSAQNRRLDKTIELYKRMLEEGFRPDEFCSSSVLTIVDSLRLGIQVHCYISKVGLVSDVSVGCALFTMYSKCGCLEEAYEVFDQIREKDEVSWTSMIAGFAENGYANRAFQLFGEMMHEEIRPDQMTLSATLTACYVDQSLLKGKEVHGYAIRVGFERETLVGSTLVTMYSKCKSLVSARRVFELMPQKDHISFSSLISGYARKGFDRDALFLFHEMLISGLNIDSFTLSSLLGMYAMLSKSDMGMQLHTHIVKRGLHTDLSVLSSLITMYSKCGIIDESRKVFDQIDNPDVITWTAMVVGYAQHGKGIEALKVYELLKERGVRPDSVTFIAVLSACSHSGLVEEGYFHLNSMTNDYGIEPGQRHYACMVDLLGRSGRLKEAESFINNMRIKPDSLVWGALLAACKTHGDVDLGKLAAKRVLELEPFDAGAYVSLSNIFADVGQWEKVLDIRSRMKDAGVSKEPGWSSM